MTAEIQHFSVNSQNSLTIRINKKSYSISIQAILLAIMGIAVLLRLASAWYQGNTVTDLPGIYDQISYDGLARRVIDGYGFSFAEGHWPATPAEQPTAHWSYLYTLYLSAIYTFFGKNPLIARIIQAFVAATFQTVLTWRIGTRLFNQTVGLIAAALTATYIYFFYYAGALITETFYITGILWILDSALRLADIHQDEEQEIHWWQWFEFGLAISITVLLRQVFFVFLPVIFFWLWWYRCVPDVEISLWKRRINWPVLRGLSFVTLIIALLIIPWTIRNYRVFKTFSLLNTNAGFAFFWGNHPIYGTHFVPLLPSTQSYYDLIPPELRNLNEAEMDKALLKLGIQFIVDDPGRFLLLSISRSQEFFKFWPSSGSGLISNISRVGSFGLSLPFVLYGLWCALILDRKTRLADRQAGISLLALFILVYTALHLFSWALIRYRLPIDAVLLIFAAYGIERLIVKYIPS